MQIAAGVMLAARRLLPRHSQVSAHSLLVAGGAAGIAAAFNTPLAGVMFAIEELSRSPEQRNSGLIVAGIVLAGMMAVSIHGNATHFGIIHPGPIGLALALPGFTRDPGRGCGRRPVRPAAAGLRPRQPAGEIVRVEKVPARAVRRRLRCAGGGHRHRQPWRHVRQRHRGHARHAGRFQRRPPAFVAFKYVATWLTVWSGVPAGIFAPSLAIGAGIGHDIAVLLHYPHAPALIALGMVGFLAAATQASPTAFIIVIEMVDGHGMVLSLMACAVVASTVSRVLSEPLYGRWRNCSCNGCRRRRTQKWLQGRSKRPSCHAQTVRVPSWPIGAPGRACACRHTPRHAAARHRRASFACSA